MVRGIRLVASFIIVIISVADALRYQLGQHPQNARSILRHLHADLTTRSQLSHVIMSSSSSSSSSSSTSSSVSNMDSSSDSFIRILDKDAPSVGIFKVGSSTKSKSNNNSNNNTKEYKTILHLTAGDVMGEKGNDGGANAGITMKNELLSARIIQMTTGPVPRSFVPAILLITNPARNLAMTPATVVYSIVEEALKWYLDSGGRVARLEIACPPDLVDAMKAMNLDIMTSSEAVSDQVLDLRKNTVPSDFVVFSASASKLKQHAMDRLALGNGDAHSLWDIVGRLTHDSSDPKGAIKPYTASLQANPKSAAVFRNLGSAYHGAGDLQLAFASYQQSVQLDPSDALVYLKLAFFYEDFATKDWMDAAEHSQRCYEYYLDNVDPEDTSVLTRLGNLLVREHKSEEAIKVYNRALAIDNTLHNVWFNKAHAQIKIGDVGGASESLKRTLELDPTIVAARHMLIALSDDEAMKVSSTEDAYIKDLFDGYAQTYDNHGKKLMYSAPRVIRQELAKIYRARLGAGGLGSDFSNPEAANSPSSTLSTSASATSTTANTASSSLSSSSSSSASIPKTPAFAPATEPVGSGCSTYTSFVNGTLDILDIGCGTGLAGAWLKDYARTMVGVDLSEQMINVARKKMLYQELHVQPMGKYLEECKKTFDIVVAADVLSYVGDLQQTFTQVSKVLRKDAHFAFTVEEAAPDSTGVNQRGYRLLRSGRFGYSKAYIDGLIANCMGSSFSVPLAREFSPRLDAGEAVRGFLYIVQKN